MSFLPTWEPLTPPRCGRPPLLPNASFSKPPPSCRAWKRSGNINAVPTRRGRDKTDRAAHPQGECRVSRRETCRAERRGWREPALSRRSASYRGRGEGRNLKPNTWRLEVPAEGNRAWGVPLLRTTNGRTLGPLGVAAAVASPGTVATAKSKPRKQNAFCFSPKGPP